MTGNANPVRSSLKFLLLGGWTAIKNATISCLFVVPLNIVLIALIYSWQDGTQLHFPSTGEVRDFVATLAFLLPVAIIISSIPAFLGGVVLTWLMTRVQSRPAYPHKPNLGALLGALTGLLLILSILIPGNFSGETLTIALGMSGILPYRYIYFMVLNS